MPAHRIHAHQRRFAGIRLGIMLTGSLSLAGVLSQAQNPPDPGQPAVAASLNDTLMAKATTLYDSTAKSGLHSFDCQIHKPLYKRLLRSSPSPRQSLMLRMLHKEKRIEIEIEDIIMRGSCI